jgi:predicted kinase
MSLLIVFAGLPGTGKSTIAERAAERLKAVYLRIDTIEQAIRVSDALPPGAGIGCAGYSAAYRLAADNLRLGHKVIADSVNPLKVTRDAYKDVAERSGARLLDVEIVCSDKARHRERVESRQATVAGLILPRWEEVEAREYQPWDRPCLRIDTALLSIEECVERVVTAAI